MGHLQDIRRQRTGQCSHAGCTMSLDFVCDCTCLGKYHGVHKARNHYLEGTHEEYLLTEKRPIVILN